MEEITTCQICNDKEFEPHLMCKDNTVSKETFSIVRCKKCLFKFTNPRPEAQAIGNYYKSEEYISHSDVNKGLFNKLYKIARYIMIGQKIKELGKTKGSVLEIGSGTGNLLAACKKKGWKITGIEPSKIAAKKAKKNHRINLFQNLEQAKIKNNSQDKIMMWHVLEHIDQLNKTLSELKNYLKDSGTIIIAVPNHLSYDALYYKEDWAAYDVPRHLSHFSKKSMKELLHKNGFEIINVKPMWLDSFYVSMLSEKIKTGKIKFLKSIIIGLKSNLKALFNTKEYSSIIYVAKKRF